MNRYIIAVTILVCVTSSAADFINLRNGQATRTKIIDTADCKVYIQRGENRVGIKKDLIEFIVWGSDTIRFAESVCPSNDQVAQRRDQTAEFKLLNLLKRLPEQEARIESTARIGIVMSPLNGRYNIDEFVILQKCVREEFKNFENTTMIEAKKGLDEVLSPREYDFLFICKEYHVEETRLGSKPVYHNHNDFNPIPSVIQTNTLILTRGEFVMVDLRTRSICFNRTHFEKGYAGTAQPYVFTLFSNTDELRQKWHNTAIERKLTRGADVIMRKVKRDVRSFLRNRNY